MAGAPKGPSYFELCPTVAPVPQLCSGGAWESYIAPHITFRAARCHDRTPR